MIRSLKVLPELKSSALCGYTKYIQRLKAADEYNELAAFADKHKGLIPLPLPGNEQKATPEKLPKLPSPKSQVPPGHREDGKPIDVCIIGAGAAGLFTGMIFDFLKTNAGLNISYKILESADGTTRKGGRLFTYKFPQKPGEPVGSHDYYDVGAMRFPEAPQMQRVFDLFNYLDMKKKSDNPPGPIIPYYMKSHFPTLKDKSYDPYYFNNIRTQGLPNSHDDPDPFSMNAQPNPSTGKIDPDAMMAGPAETLRKVVKDFVHKNGIIPPQGDEVNYTRLFQFDHYSARSYLQGTADYGPGYNYATIEWLETFEGGTGWYDQSWVETVLEFLDFSPLGSPGVDGLASECENTYQWWCIDGGTVQLVERMEEKLEHPENLVYGRTVTKIAPAKPCSDHKLEVTDNSGTPPEKYHAVFASPPLGCMRRIDMSGLGNLQYDTKLALRAVSYGAAAKVGIKFRTPWWREERFKLGLGGVAYTDGNLRMCVYPSYELDLKEPGVLMASYCWTQDAMRLSSLISPNSPDNSEEPLLEILFHELALLHSDKVSYDKMKELLREQYIDHHAWNWYSGADSTGAFAFFGPGQYAKLLPALTIPEAQKRLYFMGEHTSSFHAWVVGALDSAVRAVWQFCKANKFEKAANLLENGGPASYPFAPLPPDFEPKVLEYRQNLRDIRDEYIQNQRG